MIAFQPRLALRASCLVLATLLATPALAAPDDQAAPAADTQSPDAEAPGGGGQLSEIVVTAQIAKTMTEKPRSPERTTKAPVPLYWL